MKFKIFLVFSLFFSGTILSPSAKGMDISVGAYTWYASWEEKQIFKDKSVTADNSGIIPIDFGSALMYGPLVALKFNNEWSLSSLFLFSSSFTYNFEGQPVVLVFRSDSDTLLNYNINKYLKAFAGIKHMSYSYQISGQEMSWWSVGPGLGIGVTLPIWDNFYLLMNVSGMYLIGKANPGSSDATAYGYNIAANIAYYIEAISLTVSAGYRYQFFRSYYADDTSYYEENSFSGFTASVIYTF